MLKQLAGALVLVLVSTASMAAGDEPPAGRYYTLGLAPLYLEAAGAAKRGDTAASEAAFAKALQLAPDDDITLWEAAQASAQGGHGARSLELLARLAARRPGWDPREEPAFASLIGDAHFQELGKVLAPAATGRAAAAVAFTVDEEDLIPEGLAWDPETRTLFLGSIHKRKVIAIGPDGRSRDLTRPGQDGLLSALGMTVDRGLLWVASYVESGPGAGAAAVHAFDTRSGRTVEKYELPAGDQKRLLNDLVLVGDSVYVTESLRGALYRVDRKAKKLEAFLPERTFIYPNGIAADREGRRLFVASWGPGVSIVDLATRKVSQLAYAPGTAPIGVDGLYLVDGSLIAVQNGVLPNRVTRFRLNEAATAIVRADVIESAHPAFEIPTTGVPAGRDFYVIANAQLRRVKDGRIVKPTEPVRILRLSLD